MSNKLVKVLEYLVNEEREKASDLLHDVFVEKAKAHWSALSESDESVEEDIQEEDLDEAYFGGDAEEDFLSDIESAEDEIDAEETYEDEDMDDEEPVDGEEMDMEIDMGEIEGEPEMDSSPEPEEAMSNVEDAIAELRAAFADLMGDEEEGPEMEDEGEEEMMAFGEGAKMHNVNVSHTDGDDGKASPLKDAGNEMGNPHPTDVSEEKGGSAPAVKDMGVTGPQEAGKMKPAPAPKKAE
jgi:hypothetical protein